MLSRLSLRVSSGVATSGQAGVRLQQVTAGEGWQDSRRVGRQQAHDAAKMCRMRCMMLHEGPDARRALECVLPSDPAPVLPRRRRPHPSGPKPLTCKFGSSRAISLGRISWNVRECEPRAQRQMVSEGRKLGDGSVDWLLTKCLKTPPESLVPGSTSTYPAMKFQPHAVQRNCEMRSNTCGWLLQARCMASSVCTGQRRPSAVK